MRRRPARLDASLNSSSTSLFAKVQSPAPGHPNAHALTSTSTGPLEGSANGTGESSTDPLLAEPVHGPVSASHAHAPPVSEHASNTVSFSSYGPGAATTAWLHAVPACQHSDGIAVGCEAIWSQITSSESPGAMRYADGPQGSQLVNGSV